MQNIAWLPAADVKSITRPTEPGNGRYVEVPTQASSQPQQEGSEGVLAAQSQQRVPHKGQHETGNRSTGVMTTDGAGSAKHAQAAGAHEGTSATRSRRRHSQPRRKESRPTSQESRVGQPKTGSQATRWWDTLDQDDPISLEPLAKLRYPPFSLRNLPEPEPEPEPEAGELPELLERNTECHPRKLIASQKQQQQQQPQQQQQQQQQPGARSECVTHFDGRVLAHYLASTLSFVHPITRRDLTLSECEQLDAYLTLHRLGRPRVVQAFQRKDEPQQLNSMATSQVDLQAESAALLQSLFSSARHGPIRAGRNLGAIRNARRLQAAVMNLRTANATAEVAEAEETANAELLVRSESARDPRPTAPASTTTVQPGEQGMMQYPTLYGRPSQTVHQPKGSWCAPVLSADARVVDVARDFPMLSAEGTSQHSKKTRMQQRWGKSRGARKPLTMADLLGRSQ